MLNFHLIPPDVRDFENALEALDPPGQKTEARNFRRFLARFVERLKSQADSEVRFSLLEHFSQRREQASLAEGAHHCAKMPLTGKNDLGGACEKLRPINGLRLVAEIMDSLQYGAYVAAAVIDESNHKSPLVLGSRRFSRVSREHA